MSATLRERTAAAVNSQPAEVRALIWEAAYNLVAFGTYRAFQKDGDGAEETAGALWTVLAPMMDVRQRLHAGELASSETESAAKPEESGESNVSKTADDGQMRLPGVGQKKDKATRLTHYDYQLLEILRRSIGMTARELSRAAQKQGLGSTCSPSSMYEHLNRLRDHGLAAIYGMKLEAGMKKSTKIYVAI